ncbi:MAG: DUF4131 domain-containing protein, partial [Clostridiaceae bacterium]|nr:DUF4131 domain-containing protein [Clostridiaceae bacterium]
MKRPLAFFCLSQIAGILTASLTDSYIFVLVSSVVGALILLSLFGNKKPLVYGIMVLFYLAGAFHYLYYTRDNASKFEEFNGEQVVVKGYVYSEPDINKPKISYIIKTEEIYIKGDSGNSKKISGRILLSKYISDKETIFEHGKEITLSGRLRLPKGRTNPGGFDFRRFLSQEGVSATIFATDRNIKHGSRVSSNVFVQAGLFLRARIISVINQSLPPQQAGLLNGMLIGYREGLSEDVQNVFSDSGLTHIMAVSGANIAFIVFPLVFLFKKLRLGRTVANILIIG